MATNREGVQPILRGGAVANLPTAGTSTVAQLEAKINELLAALRATGIVGQ